MASGILQKVTIDFSFGIERVDMREILAHEYSVAEDRDLPRTVGHAVDILLGLLPVEEMKRIAAMSWEERISFQVALGMWIRKNFRLWSVNSALINDSGRDTADGASLVVSRALYQRLDKVFALQPVAIETLHAGRVSHEAKRITQSRGIKAFGGCHKKLLCIFVRCNSFERRAILKRLGLHRLPRGRSRSMIRRNVISPCSNFMEWSARPRKNSSRTSNNS